MADATGDELIARLERRVARERAAREEAEQIAENGMLELWRHSSELDREVELRTRELSRALDAARAADRSRREFLGHLGHELATPLHGVLGRLELIDSDRLTTNDQQRLAEARQDAATLAALLEGLVALSAAEGRDRRHDPSAELVTTVLDRIVGRWAPKLAARGQLLIPVTDGPDHPVEAEWGRVDETADILLDNTVRFADAGPVRVDLTVGAAALQFVVTDAGPGLDAGQRAQALAPFVRIESGGRLGVGLAIASRIAELGGGRLDLDDADGGGLRASIELPIMTGPDGE